MACERNSRAVPGGGGRARGRGLTVLPGVVVGCGAALAQEEGGPCDPPTEKKLLKRIDEAAGTRNPSERHQRWKALLEEEPECMECLWRTGESAFQRAQAGAGSFSTGIAYLERLK